MLRACRHQRADLTQVSDKSARSSSPESSSPNFYLPNSMRQFDRTALFIEACLKYGVMEANDSSNILFVAIVLCSLAATLTRTLEVQTQQEGVFSFLKLIQVLCGVSPSSVYLHNLLVCHTTHCAHWRNLSNNFAAISSAGLLPLPPSEAIKILYSFIFCRSLHCERDKQVSPVR